MAQATWEKSGDLAAAPAKTAKNNAKFAIAGGVMLFGLAILIVAGTLTGGHYFITIKDMLARPNLVGKTVKISGAVIGHTIHFDSTASTIEQWWRLARRITGNPIHLNSDTLA